MGVLAVCQACNAPNSEDSSRLVIFDLEAGVETGSCVPESGWAASYEFPTDRPVVRLVYLKGEAFDYGLDGTFLEREKWVEASFAKGDVYLVQRLLRAAGEGLPPDLAKRCTVSLESFLINASDPDPRTRALALKLNGSCLEVLGDYPGALRSYDAALALDPKIGVKRRADQLHKS
ncbi:tetratricopeptide repeat protein [Brevundimonas vesicularis]|uniref:tetratricopeptide repeat protein n=1 Tax=Brevundimonas vesicularis TaxID=41276 RepID=UPI0038D498F3